MYSNNKQLHPPYFVMFIAVLATFCCFIFAPALSVAQSNAVASAAVRCGPQPGLMTCSPTPECDGIIRKAFTPGCRGSNGKPLLDGGCQCKGYCGYMCAAGCQADPECRWNKSKKKCFNIATGKAGKPLKICAATNSPTTVTSMPSSTPTIATSKPTTTPTSAPTPKATDAPVLPTSQPTKTPTAKGYCTHDAKFPGREFDAQTTRTVAISPNGNVVLLYEQRWVKNESNPGDEPGTPVLTLWTTTRNENNGKWNPKKVGTYENIVYISAAMSQDGTHLVFYLEPYRVGPPTPGEFSTNLKMYFVKLTPNGKYKTLKVVTFENSYAIHPQFWMSPKGDTAIATYLAETDAPWEKLPKITETYVRQQDTWRLDKTQEGVFLSEFSRDGKTAFDYGANDTHTFRRIRVRNNKEWSLQVANLIASGSPDAYYQGSGVNSFSPDGNVFVMSTGFGVNGDLAGDNGAFVFTRSNGNWTQQVKIGGGQEGQYTGISDDLNTIMLSTGMGLDNKGFKIFKKSGSTWIQAGEPVFTNASSPLLNAKGNRVITRSPPTAWKC